MLAAATGMRVLVGVIQLFHPLDIQTCKAKEMLFIFWTLRQNRELRILCSCHSIADIRPRCGMVRYDLVSPSNSGWFDRSGFIFFTSTCRHLTGERFTGWSPDHARYRSYHSAGFGKYGATGTATVLLHTCFNPHLLS